MMRRALAVCALLAGCATPMLIAFPPPQLRDTAAQMGSQTGVSAKEIAGDWAVRRVVEGSRFPPGDKFALVADGAALFVTWPAIGCSDAVNLCEEFSARVPFLPDGPGRWQRDPADGNDDNPRNFWVFWTDGTRRTMAIGSPDGDFAMIVDRNETGGADRIAAATEILDWYGFDTSTLIERTP